MAEVKEKDIQMGVHVHGNLALKEAHYQLLPMGNGKEQMILNDEIIHSEITLDGFKLLYSRKMRLSPSAFFEMSVVYESVITFDDNAGREVLKTLECVEEWVQNNQIRIVNTFNLPSKASHLLADISEGAGFVPIVTQPSYASSESE